MTTKNEKLFSDPPPSSPRATYTEYNMHAKARAATIQLYPGASRVIALAVVAVVSKAFQEFMQENAKKSRELLGDPNVLAFGFRGGGDWN